MIPYLSRLLVSTTALALAGCGGSSTLTTGSIFGGSQPAVDAAPQAAVVTNDPTARALQVGAVSARAAKCGFYFDPTKLKAAFIAAEARQGATPEQLAKVEREYDYTRTAVASRIATQPDYCTKTKTAEIKVDLTRHLAGDFTAPQKVAKAASDDSWFGSWTEPQGREVLNPEWIKNPQWEKKTKPVE